MIKEIRTRGIKVLSYFIGGGGYGDPLERDPKSVYSDIQQNKISSERAFEVYGVVIDKDKGNLNIEETVSRRKIMISNRDKFSMEPEVIPAKQIFTDDTPPIL